MFEIIKNIDVQKNHIFIFNFNWCQHNKFANFPFQISDNFCLKNPKKRGKTINFRLLEYGKC